MPYTQQVGKRRNSERMKSVMPVFQHIPLQNKAVFLNSTLVLLR